MRQLTRHERAVNYAGIAAGLMGFSRRPFAPRQAIDAYQLVKLREVVAWAYERVPLYRQLYRAAGVQPRDLRTLSDLRFFPSITKRQILDAFPDGCLARGTRLGSSLVSKSSGSTGEVLSVVHRPEGLAAQGLALFRLLGMIAPYRPWDRFTYVYTSEYPARGALRLYPMEWIHTLAPIPEIASRLQARPPRFLACYPSHLRAIANDLGERRCRALELAGISVSSELSTQSERAHLSLVFGCPVLDEYSTEELTRVAAQCRAGTYHLFEDVVLTEILPEGSDEPLGEGMRGEVTGTYLHGMAMPFIRYRQGDIADVRGPDGNASSHRRCGCGRMFRALGPLEGRRLDSFTLPSGRTLTSGYLLDATYAFLFDVGADLAAFRMVQEEVDRVRIEIVPGAAFASWMAEGIERRFRELAGEPLTLEVVKVEAIAPSATGKRHPIVSYVRPSPP